MYILRTSVFFLLHSYEFTMNTDTEKNIFLQCTKTVYINSHKRYNSAILVGTTGFKKRKNLFLNLAKHIKKLS